MLKNLMPKLAVALFAAAMVATPAAALDNDPMGTALTKGDLEKDGYKCVVVGVGFWECTKGDKTYWCDTGSCQPKPRRQTDSGRRPVGTVGGSTMVMR
jgi:hypothetical protein